MNLYKISHKFKNEDFKLCYIKDNFAYFTTNDIYKQWGDDWDDAPYEHNAGEPYDGEGVEIVKVAYVSEMTTPCDYICNSSYSVGDINSGAISWLRTPSYVKEKINIFAGEPVDSFMDKVIKQGGEIFTPISWIING